MNNPLKLQAPTAARSTTFTSSHSMDSQQTRTTLSTENSGSWSATLTTEDTRSHNTHHCTLQILGTKLQRTPLRTPVSTTPTTYHLRSWAQSGHAHH